MKQKREALEAKSLAKRFFIRLKEHLQNGDYTHYLSTLKDIVEYCSHLDQTALKLKLYQKAITAYVDAESVIKNFPEELKEFSLQKLSLKFKSEIYLKISEALFRE